MLNMKSRMINLLKAISIVSVLLPLPASAIQEDFDKPISASSNQQIAELNKNKLTFIDNVEIKQGTLKINANKVEIFKNDKGQVDKIISYGNPVTYTQMMDNNRPIEAKSQILSYDTINKIIVLQKKASITQEDSQISGEKIEYDLIKETMKAQGEKKKDRVITTFVPSNLKKQIEDSKPRSSDNYGIIKSN